MVALSLLSLLLATTTLAAPLQSRCSSKDACHVNASALSLPPPLSPIQTPLRFTTMGVGMQNYTCTPNGTYESVGAVVQMFEVSCLFGKPEFAKIQQDAYTIWNECSDTDPLENSLAKIFKNLWDIDVFGQHYFVQQNGSLIPVFDSTSSAWTKGNQNAIFFGKEIQDIRSPESDDNVDWLEVQKVSGDLADDIYRVYTVKGQPPASCKPGSSDISVKFSTKYLLIGGSI